MNKTTKIYTITEDATPSGMQCLVKQRCYTSMDVALREVLREIQEAWLLGFGQGYEGARYSIDVMDQPCNEDGTVSQTISLNFIENPGQTGIVVIFTITEHLLCA